MKQASLIVLVLLIGGAIGAGWFLSADSGGDGDTNVSLLSSRNEDGTAELVQADGEADENLIEREVEPEAGAARTAAAALGQDFDASTAVFVEGSVKLPGDCALDETLEVFALTEEVSYGELLRGLDHPSPSASAVKRLERALHARATVESDGSFRVAFPEGADAGFVMLRGAHLYTLEAVPVDPTRAQSLTIEPLSGTHVQGQLTAPKGVAPSLLAGVEVQMRTDVSTPNPMDLQSAAMRVVRAAVKTGPDGSFEIRALPADKDYVVTVRHDELAAYRTSMSGFHACTDHALTIPMERGGSVAGVVVDADGSPLAGAKVQALLAGQWFGFDDFDVREGKTGSDGSFLLKAVPAGGVSLRAELEGHLESKKKRIDVPQEGVIDGLTLSLAEGRSISGSLVWESGEPAQGITVRARFDQAHLAGPSAFNALRGASGKTKAGADGSFVLKGLGAGPFILQASAHRKLNADGDVITELDLGDSSDDEEHAQELDDSVVLSARVDGVKPGAEGLELVLRAPMGLHGVVVDQQGTPLNKFSVSAQRISDGAFGEVFTDTREGTFESEDGAFFLEGMIEGTWKVHVEGDNYVTLEPVSIELPAETRDDPLLVEVMLTASVAGTVRGPDGEVVPGATISIDTGTPSWQAAIAGRVVPTAETDPEGHFELKGIAPEQIGIYADADDYARSPSVTVDLQPGDTLEEVELVLTLGGTLTGIVYDSEGEPASGRMIALNDMKTFDSKATTSDGDGSFRFDHLLPGTWQVVAMDRGADWGGSDGDESGIAGMMDAMTLSQATIIEGELTHIVLGAPPEDPVRIHGRVSHGDGAYSGAMVSFFPEGSRLYERMVNATVADDGTYELTVDGPGSYVVSIAKLPVGGGAGQQNTIEFAREIPELADVRVDFKIPLGRISGRIVDADGRPASSARVTLTHSGGVRTDHFFGGQYTELPTDANGKFDIEGLRPGKYRLSAGGASFMNLGSGARFGRVILDDIHVGENEWKKDVEIRLPGPGTIEANVLDLMGQPAMGADIFVRDTQGRVMEPFSFVMTDSSGKAKFEGLSPGEYTVSARVDGFASVESSPVKVREGETTKVDLRLEDGAVLVIRVKDPEGDGSQATIRVEDSEGREMTGMFGLQDLQKLYLEGGFSRTEHRLGPLAPGKYRIYAESNGLRTSKPVTIRGGDERKLTLRLKDRD